MSLAGSDGSTKQMTVVFERGMFVLCAIFSPFPLFFPLSRGMFLFFAVFSPFPPFFPFSVLTAARFSRFRRKSASFPTARVPSD